VVSHFDLYVTFLLCHGQVLCVSRGLCLSRVSIAEKISSNSARAGCSLRSRKAPEGSKSQLIGSSHDIIYSYGCPIDVEKTRGRIMYVIGAK